MELTLRSLKAYLIEKQQTSLADLVKNFNSDAECIQMMLRHFIVRGSLKETRLTSRCGSVCHQCQLSKMAVYRWVLAVNLR